MSQQARRPLPSNSVLSRFVRRLPPVAVVLLLGGLVLAAGITHRQGMATQVPASAALVTRDFRFEDRPDGSIAVQDAATGKVVQTITGQAGFLRATVRGLAQQRLRQDLGADAPFRLTAWADGRLTLDDPATLRHIELEAFGETNEAAFAELLTARGGTQ